MSELERLKSYLNQTELQLYEANEHISDLLEKASIGIFSWIFFCKLSTNKFLETRNGSRKFNSEI
jgi:hypothetical protein